MMKRLISAILLTCSTLSIVSANNCVTGLNGAWKGPNDLMVDLCVDNYNQLYVCSCGIFRAYGWNDCSTVVSGDSLIITSTDIYNPFEGRFMIESDKLVGTLAMGNPDAAWYYMGSTELIKQKPVMPDNLNGALEGIILPKDYGLLSLDRDKALQALASLSPRSYGYAELHEVRRLLEAKTYPVAPAEMVGFKRVRSIQIDARDGIFSYPYFNCRFREIDGRIFFEKTSGSQRKSGYVYQNNPESLIFLGGWSVNDDPQTLYGSDNSVAGKIYKIGPRKAIMILPSDDNRVEIYEFIKPTDRGKR
ncbi:MAG: DUF4893 domain-containing protein [Barnesiella sp.]|nr:DUF4893 domain-containing protein [Barnesiella sp.]